MITCKDVFQLAQDKGHKLYFGTNAPCQSNPEYYKEQALCELTLIQKWLRDDKKVDIEVKNQYDISDKGKWYFPKILWANGRSGRRSLSTGIDTTYEQALLIGIYEALKLLP